MMYLSRLTFKAGHPRTISEHNHPYEMHRTLCKGWANPVDARILFRSMLEKDGTLHVLVQSQNPPDWQGISGQLKHLVSVEGPKPFSMGGLKAGDTLQFRLRCRPTKRNGKKGDPRKGKRESLIQPDDILQWFSRKAQNSGFAVNQVKYERFQWFDSKEGKKGDPLGAIEFTGTLTVQDPELLKQTVENGIGTQKAYGFGLLSLARF